MIEIGIDFYGNTEADFFDGTGAIVVDTAVPDTVRLDSISFTLDLERYREASQDTLTASVVRSGQPDDELFNTEGAWWRYRSAWYGGAGRVEADLDRGVDVEDAIDQTRFNDSRGIDVWTGRELKLLPDIEIINATSTTAAFLVEASGQLYHIWMNGATVAGNRYLAYDEVPDPITGTITGTVTDVATDGIDVFIATTTNLYKVVGAAAAVFTAGAHTMCEFVGSRLVVAADNVLYETNAAGTRTAFYTHFSTAFGWDGVFQLGARLYAYGHAFGRAEVMLFTTTSGGALAVSAEAMSLPFGEYLNEVIEHAGVVMLCTNRGVRLGVSAGDGALSYGPLISAPGDVRCGASEGGYGWFGWSYMGDGHAGVGRWDFTNFTESALLPAYAADLAAPSGDAATTLAVARFQDRTFVVDTATGFWTHSNSIYRATGWLTSGEFYFGTVEDKLFNEIDIRCAALPAFSSIAVDLTDENGQTLVAPVTQDIAGVTEFVVSLIPSRAVSTEVTLTLTATTDRTDTPRIRQYRARAYPVVPMVQQWILPLKLWSTIMVNTASGQQLSLDSLTVFETIVDHCIHRRPINMVLGRRQRVVRLDAYEFAPAQWRDAGDFFEGTLIVKAVAL